MKLVAQYVGHMPANVSCHQFCIGITRRFADTMCNRWLHRRCPLPDPVDRLAASAVVYSRLRREIWMVGDCQCLIDGTLFENPKPYEAELARRRADIIRHSADQKHFLVDDTARQQILPDMMRIMRQQQNVAYAVIDGARIPEQHVIVLPLDFCPHDIVLASDGYPQLLPTLEASEAALARQLSDDPLNIGTFQATKGCMQGNQSFDDRAYIRFKV